MYKLIVLAAIVAVASADAVLPAGYAYAGHPGYAYAGHPGYAVAGHPGYAVAGHPGYAYAGHHLAHAPVVAAPVQYALPPAREVVNAPSLNKSLNPLNNGVTPSVIKCKQTADTKTKCDDAC